MLKPQFSLNYYYTHNPNISLYLTLPWFSQWNADYQNSTVIWVKSSILALQSPIVTLQRVILKTDYGKGLDSQLISCHCYISLCELVLMSCPTCVLHQWCPVFHIISYILFMIIINLLFISVTTVLCLTIVNLDIMRCSIGQALVRSQLTVQSFPIVKPEVLVMYIFLPDSDHSCRFWCHSGGLLCHVWSLPKKCKNSKIQ